MWHPAHTRASLGNPLRDRPICAFRGPGSLDLPEHPRRNVRPLRVFRPLMPDSPTFRTTPARLIAAALVLALTAVGLILVSPSGAANQTAKLLGGSGKTPKPLCPKDCRGTGSVTGFQVLANGRKSISRIPDDGHIVAWSVELSKPDKGQIAGFGELFEDKKFGTEPVARLSVLKKAKGKKKSRYTLAKQTPTVPMLEHLGSKPVIALNKPLKVKKGQIAALTLPTWAPLFTDTLNKASNSWKASRAPGECGADTVIDAKPHMRKGSTRTYGCTLTGERVVYWAYFVPDKGKGGGGGGGKN